MATEGRRPDSVLQALTKPMAPKPRSSVFRRYEAMLRELKFLAERRDENLQYIRDRNWTDARLSMLFGLNSVYQEVLGPLQASARSGTAGLGSEYPITHGSQRFDSAHTARVTSALEDFFALVFELGFQRAWMTKNTCGDLVFFIARFEREQVPGADRG